MLGAANASVGCFMVAKVRKIATRALRGGLTNLYFFSVGFAAAAASPSCTEVPAAAFNNVSSHSQRYRNQCSYQSSSFSSSYSSSSSFSLQKSVSVFETFAGHIQDLLFNNLLGLRLGSNGGKCRHNWDRTSFW